VRPGQEERAADEQTASPWEGHESLFPQTKVNDQQALELLFTLLAQLRQHPELIPVAGDFIRELMPGE